MSTWLAVVEFVASDIGVAPNGAGNTRSDNRTDGRITAATGVSPHGQGNETTFAQMLADQFGVPLEHVRILHGDTGVVKQGIGTFGSRSQAVGGTALHMAGGKVKVKMAKFAGAMLEAHEMNRFENGTILARGRLHPRKFSVWPPRLRAVPLPEGLELPEREAVFERPTRTRLAATSRARESIARQAAELLKLVALRCWELQP